MLCAAQFVPLQRVHTARVVRTRENVILDSWTVILSRACAERVTLMSLPVGLPTTKGHDKYRGEGSDVVINLVILGSKACSCKSNEGLGLLVLT
jgi:hypothetical protein